MKDESKRTLVESTITLAMSQGNQLQGKQHKTRKTLNTITIGW